MKSQPSSSPSERQIDTDARDHAQETLYAVTHGGRERHPEQHDTRQEHSKEHKQPEPPWQID